MDEADSQQAGLRVLILGTSNTERTAGGPTWADLIAAQLELVRKKPAIFTHRNLFVGGTGAEDYAIAQVARYEPDIVIIGPSATTAILPNVAVRLDQLLGRRSAPIRAAVSWFDWKCLAAGRPGRVVYRVAHSGMRRALGARPLHTVDDAIRSYSEIFARLAQIERVEVIVVGYVEPAQAKHDTRVANESRRFDAAMKAAAGRWRFAWANGQASVMDIDDWRTSFHVDGVHMTALGHQRMAAAVGPVLVRVALDLEGAADGRHG